MNEDKFEKWGSFENWVLSNANRLSQDYDNLKAKFNSKLDGISYTEYIGARWQRNEL